MSYQQTDKTALFDCCAAYGGTPRKMSYPRTPLVSMENLLSAMKRLKINKALVRSAPLASGCDIVERNRRLLAECGKTNRFVPCPILIPATAGDLPAEEDQLDEFIGKGARAVWIRPATDRYILSEVVTARMFQALIQRRMPAFCFMENVPLTDIDMLLCRHAGLRIIIAGVGYGQIRVIKPMLQAYPGLYLGLGGTSMDHNFLSLMIAARLTKQILFGTGFPESEPMMGITQLMYADISDADKCAIGAENLERLLAEVII